MKPRIIWISLVGLLVLASGLLIYSLLPNSASGNSPFDGQRAWEDVAYQVSLGPRTPSSRAHAQAIHWISTELKRAGWHAEIQPTEMLGHAIQNIYATRNEETPQILLVAHYDSRLLADRDPDPTLRSEPVPGANDGASGVAVLLELARTLPFDTVPVGLLFTDAEDNGNIPGWDWILGARAFASTLTEEPQAVVVVDMVGDADLALYIEKNSSLMLAQAIWAQAAELGHQDVFINESKYSILDDHLPFIQLGIPSIDIIDLEYVYWHTTEDTPDKVSPDSLQAVGETIWHWLVSQP